MAKLYPPYIEGSLPAGHIDGNQWVIKFPYQMNRAVSPIQVSGIKVLIKTIHKNEIVFPENSISGIIPIAATMKDGQFIIDLKIKKTKLVNIGQYYKIQLAYVDTVGNTGYYSTVGIIKCIDKPTMEIVGMNQYGSNFYNGAFQGLYKLNQSTADLSERVYSYEFNIYDDKGKIYATSGIRIHDNNADQYAYECTDFWTPERLGEDSKFYQIQYSVTTLNGGQFSTPKYRLQMQAAINMEPQIVIYPIPDFENGCIEVVLIGEPDMYTIEETKCTGTYTICRKEINKYRDNSWIEVHRFRLSDEYPSSHSFRDFTVEQGVIYKYSIQQMNNYGVYSKRIVSAPAYADFEDMFLFDGKRALKVRFNPKVSSFKTTLQESKTDTIGHKYPYFFRNGAVAYKEFPIAGLLSYFVDDNELFITDEKLGLEPDPSPRKNSLRWGSWSDTYPGHSVHEDHEKMVNTLPYSDTNVEYENRAITYRKNSDKLLEKYESYLYLLKQIDYYSSLESLSDRPADDIEHLFSLVRKANQVVRPILMKYPEEFADTWYYDDTFGIQLIRFNKLYFYDENKYYETLDKYRDLEGRIERGEEEQPPADCCSLPIAVDDCCNPLDIYRNEMNLYAIPMKEYFRKLQDELNAKADLNDAYSEYYQYYNKPAVFREIWLEQRKKEAERKVRTRNFKGYNFYAERTFKLEALDWLNDGKPKLFKSPGEGNYIVRLMNVSMSPEDALSRLIHNFSCQAYEMADARSQADLLKCGLLMIRDFNIETFKPNYHWRTEWMHKYYKPIHSAEDYFYLELDYDYIITIEARDFLLGDWFEIHRKGDPQTDEYWEKIVITETGNYIMQHELVPIDGIRLKYSDYDYVRPGHIDICYADKYTSPFDAIKSIKTEPIIAFQLPGKNKNIYENVENRRFNEWEHLKISLRPFIPVYREGDNYFIPSNYAVANGERTKKYETDPDVLDGQPLIKYSSFLDLVDDVASTWAIYSIRTTSQPHIIREYRYWQPSAGDFGTNSTLGNYIIAFPVGAIRTDGTSVFDTDEDAFIYDIRYAINEVPGTLNDQISYVEYHNLGRVDRLYLGNGLLLEGICNNFKIEIAAEVRTGGDNGIITTEETAEIWH